MTMQQSIKPLINSYKRHILQGDATGINQILHADAELICAQSLNIFRGDDLGKQINNMIPNDIMSITDLELGERDLGSSHKAVLYKCQLIQKNNRFYNLCISMVLVKKLEEWLILQQHIALQ